MTERIAGLGVSQLVTVNLVNIYPASYIQNFFFIPINYISFIGTYGTNHTFDG